MQSARSLRSSGFWHFFQIFAKFHLLVPLQAMRRAAAFAAWVFIWSKYPYKPWEGPPFLLPRSSHTDLHNYGTKKMRHFARPFRVLKSGIVQIRIIAGILRSGLWYFCHICEILLSSTLTGHVKCHCFPATAPYFYGSILLRALKSEIIVLLTYVHKKECPSN
jgi:hypothetical protein